MKTIMERTKAIDNDKTNILIPNTLTLKIATSTNARNQTKINK